MNVRQTVRTAELVALLKMLEVEAELEDQHALSHGMHTWGPPLLMSTYRDRRDGQKFTIDMLKNLTSVLYSGIHVCGDDYQRVSKMNKKKQRSKWLCAPVAFILSRKAAKQPIKSTFATLSYSVCLAETR